MLVRPIFRIFAGIIFAACVAGVILTIENIITMWNYKILDSWGRSTWSIVIGTQVFLLWAASISFLIAILGKAPKYLTKIINSKEH